MDDSEIDAIKAEILITYQTIDGIRTEISTKEAYVETLKTELADILGNENEAEYEWWSALKAVEGAIALNYDDDRLEYTITTSCNANVAETFLEILANSGKNALSQTVSDTLSEVEEDIDLTIAWAYEEKKSEINQTLFDLGLL